MSCPKRYLLKPVTSYICLENSEFFTHVFPLSKEEEVDKFIKDLEAKYPKADHLCYAYVLDEKEGFSQDGEPSNSGGYTILNILRKEKVYGVFAAVIRFYGGIKLGLPRLRRTYGDAASLALKKGEYGVYIEGEKITFDIDYKTYNQIEKIIEREGIAVLNKNFGMSINLVLLGSVTIIEAFIKNYLLNIEIKKESQMILKELNK